MKAHPRGAAWEDLAERYLHRKGLRTLTRNFHCRLGEIDLVMREGRTVVFVEVRYRRHGTHGTAVETVSHAKQLKIRRAAGIFLSRRPALATEPCRFDVVGIGGEARQPEIDWLPGAFDGG